jgi:hypothetical protein
MCRVYPNHENPLYVRVCKRAGRGRTCFILWEHLEGQWDSKTKLCVEGWMVDSYGQNEKPEPRPRKSTRLVPHDVIRGEGTDEVAMINGQPLTREQVERFSKNVGWTREDLDRIEGAKEPTRNYWHVDGDVWSGDETINATRIASGETEAEAVNMILSAVQQARGGHWQWVRPPLIVPHTSYGRSDNCWICKKLDGVRKNLGLPPFQSPPDGLIRDTLTFRNWLGLKEGEEIVLAPPVERHREDLLPLGIIPDQTTPEFQERLRAIVEQTEADLRDILGIEPIVDEGESGSTPIDESPPVTRTAYDDAMTIERGSQIVLPPFNPEPLDWTPFNEFVPEAIRQRMYAYDLAVALGFEWDFEDEEREDELYECLEQEGYEWDGEKWKLQ